MSKEYEVMADIQTEKAKDLRVTEQLPLDEEGKAVAMHRRESFDLASNAVTIDPLR